MLLWSEEGFFVFEILSQWMNVRQSSKVKQIVSFRRPILLHISPIITIIVGILFFMGKTTTTTKQTKKKNKKNGTSIFLRRVSSLVYMYIQPVFFHPNKHDSSPYGRSQTSPPPLSDFVAGQSKVSSE